MAMTRNVDDYKSSGGNFDNVYIPGGSYLARVVEVTDRKKNKDGSLGDRFIKKYKDRETGEYKERPAIVVVMRIRQVFSRNPTDEQKAVVGKDIGKKFTDSLNEKADLYKFWEVLFEAPPSGIVDYEQMIGQDCVIDVEDNSQMDANGDMIYKSFVKAWHPFFNPAVVPDDVPVPF